MSMPATSDAVNVGGGGNECDEREGPLLEIVLLSSVISNPGAIWSTKYMFLTVSETVVSRFENLSKYSAVCRRQLATR